ncbi:MAG: hypothetical protein V1772_07305, partial [Chloroflexota bacterium]
ASYVGPGGVGHFQPLMDQLRRTYAFRHPRIRLNAPADANYVLFAYPPMPFDVYDWTPNLANLDRPIGGTVRLAPDEGKLSQDLTHGGAFPLRVAWMDAGQSAGPYLSLLPPIDRITPPEYVVPAGIAYDPCFLTGKCSAGVLKAIYDTRMALRIVYLRVEPAAGRVQAVPLRAADDTWRPSGAPPAALAPMGPQAVQQKRLYLAYVARQIPYADVERPAGLFDPATGRMLGYLAPN